MILDKLKCARVKDSTRNNYYGIWKNFNKFYLRLDWKPTSWEDSIVLYIGFLINTNKSSQTLRSYLSALRVVLLEDGYELKEDKFLLSALTCACKLKNDVFLARMPIRKGMLKVLLKEVEQLFLQKLNQPYLAGLYQAFLSTAYFGLFCIGVLTKSPHAVAVKDMHIGRNKRKILFVLRSSKTHGKHMLPQTIKITSCRIQNSTQFTEDTPCDLDWCPFQMLHHYISLHPGYISLEEQFFIFADHSPVKPEHFRHVLHVSLTSAGFDANNFSVHSLRIGKASDLLKCEVSIESIKCLGRWKSNAVFRYLHNL